MSPQGRPKGEFPRGGPARQRQGGRISPQGRPKGEFPRGATAGCAEGGR